MPNRIPKYGFARASATADQCHIHLSIERTNSTRFPHESIHANAHQQTAASPTNSGIRSAIDSKEPNTLHQMKSSYSKANRDFKSSAKHSRALAAVFSCQTVKVDLLNMSQNHPKFHQLHSLNRRNPTDTPEQNLRVLQIRVGQQPIGGGG
jgi:hypothetical protein